MSDYAYNWESLLIGINAKDFKYVPRIENRRLMLSYNGTLNKDNLRSLINTVSGAGDRGEIIIGYSLDCDNDEMFTHVAVDFGRTFICKKKECARIFDYIESNRTTTNTYQPVIRTISTQNQWINVIRYVSKDDDENSHLLELYGDPSKPIVNVGKINSYNTTEEAIENCAKSMGDVLPICAIRKLKKGKYYDFRSEAGKKRYEFNPDEKPWYKYVIELDKMEPHHRAINWFWDKNGFSGKTAISKYMNNNMDHRWTILTSIGQQRDATELMYDRLVCGWKGHGVIIDLDRQCSEHKSIYGPIENIKNGMMISTKYEGKTIEFDMPHVVIFSNRLPVINRMSLDRWVIYKVEDGDATILDTNEAIKIARKEKAKLLEEKIYDLAGEVYEDSYDSDE